MLKHSVRLPEHCFQFKYLKVHTNKQAFNVGPVYYCQLIYFLYSISNDVLLHFSLSVKAVTLIFISGRDLAISSAHEGKTGNINGKTENFNCLLRVDKYKLDSVKQKDP